MRNFETVSDFMAAFGVIHIVRAALLFAIAFPSGTSLNTTGIAWSLAAGVCIAIALALYFYALSLEETTRVAPVIATTPAFTVLIAILLFHESIAALELFGLVVIVLGSIVINLRPMDNRLRFLNKKALCAAVASSFCAAWALVAMNQATVSSDPFDTELVRTLAVGVLVGLVYWRRARLRAAWVALARTETAILFVACEGVLAAGFMLLLSYALSVGPVGPVSAIATAISPIAVLIGATALSTGRWNVLGESVDRQTLILKIVGTGFIVWGVFSLRL